MKWEWYVYWMVLIIVVETLLLGVVGFLFWIGWNEVGLDDKCSAMCSSYDALAFYRDGMACGCDYGTYREWYPL